MGGIIGGEHRVRNARTNERTNEQREMKGQLALAARCPKSESLGGPRNDRLIKVIVKTG